MIRFRQKECSRKSTQAIYRTKQIINNVKPGKFKKTNIRLGRESIQLERDIKKAAETPIGKAVDAGIENVVKSPITSASFAIPIPGTTAGLAFAESSLKRKSSYGKLTESLGNAYKKSLPSKFLQSHPGPPIKKLVGA